ncbi:MAG: S1 RNA-binding domain-containing protein [Candidatus Diapherotrites archaeon]|uniref:S1 RNA-binding domain-containing protein n=1 Tax=Candidatus Iainarchaeum sp. TaxID=3101447 RepID=A0A8T3YLG1_9ARCH|nr:S1 RNA-binding domain-containing protein [Candidatus Diapherotrites archaeon]
MSDDFPEHGEIVIGRISKVLDYGVFVELLEYEGLQGFVHISNVSSSWVKNIRNFVKEGQIRAGKVIGLDRHKKQVDISLTKISPNAQRSKIEEYKQGKRAQKLIEMLAQKVGGSPESAWSEVAEPLLQKYDSLYGAFQKLLVDGEPAAGDVPKKWVGPLIELVESNFEMPEKAVRGRLSVSVAGPEGVEGVKKSLAAGQRKGGKKVQIFYEGSGMYAVKVTSVDYKSAEKVLKAVSDEVISAALSFGGKAGFEKVEAG